MEGIKRDSGSFIWRITAAHTIAYFTAGIFSLWVMKYNEIFGTGPLSFMRPADSAWDAAGPGLQVIRGFILSIFLLPYRHFFIESKNGWGKFWLLSFGLSYLLTISAATGSFEGYIYTNTPIKYHLIGIPEIVLYLTMFALLMKFWYNKPSKMMNIVSVVLVVLIVFMSMMGVLAENGIIKTP